MPLKPLYRVSGPVIWLVIRYRRRGDERSRKVGRYCGQRLQFCGLQHPNMVFESALLVRSVPTLVGHGGWDGRPRVAL